jgi:osmoprotectant transport system permease protein
LETIRFIVANLPVIWQRAVEHILLVGAAVAIAIVTGVTIGILITQDKRAADRVLYVAAVIMTIPSIALFGLLIPILSLIGQGIGYLPALIALILYSQLPIIRNTYTAIMNVDPALREAARGMGMTTLQRLRAVELPIALPVIVNGVRNAVVLNIAIAAIATYIGAGGPAPLSHAHLANGYPPVLTGAAGRELLAVIADFRCSRCSAHSPSRAADIEAGSAMIASRRHKSVRPITAVRRRSTGRAGGAPSASCLGPIGLRQGLPTMKMINRLIPPSSGKIFVDGRDTSGSTRSRCGAHSAT